MKIRTYLLAAGAAIVLPATIASAQMTTQPAATPPPAGHHSTTTTTTQAPTPPASTTTPPPPDSPSEAVPPAQTTTTTTTTPPAPGERQTDPVESDTSAQAETPPVTPPASSTTTTTTTAPATGPVVAATPADLRSGAPVRDQAGGLVGTIESADASGAVIATGTVRARLPLTSFGRNNVGVLIAMTRAQLEAAASAQNPS